MVELCMHFHLRKLDPSKTSDVSLAGVVGDTIGIENTMVVSKTRISSPILFESQRQKRMAISLAMDLVFRDFNG